MDLRAENVQIRPYQIDDLVRIKALHGRMGPYRPEDQPVVEEMFARAAKAERTGDRWVPLAPSADSLDAIEESYLAFWVAVATGPQETGELAGTVGVRRCVEMTGSGGLAIALAWQQSGDVAELLSLRVAPERWRSGIGAQLCRTVIDWSRENRFRSLVLNTTAAQVPAIALYRRLGFREVGRSFAGVYELVWLELPLES
jgi:ribosomal protein S18 acetylase RimI-like enzyme